MEEIFNTLKSVLDQLGLFSLLGIVFLIGTYIFWKESRITQKNNNSIFDLWFLSSLFVAIWGRISYIVAFPQAYRDLIWFYLPYERFNDTVYLFRNLPWRYLALWDGGFLFTAIAFAFLFSIYIFITFIKKWVWKEMFNPVVLSTQFMIVSALAGFSYYSEESEILLYCSIFFLIWAMYYAYVLITRRIALKPNFITVSYSLLSYSLLIFIFYSQITNIVDRINTILFAIMVLILTIASVSQQKVKNGEESLSEMTSNRIIVSPNKPIKFGSFKKE
jgi:hypothetical protein